MIGLCSNRYLSYFCTAHSRIFILNLKGSSDFSYSFPSFLNEHTKSDERKTKNGALRIDIKMKLGQWIPPDLSLSLSLFFLCLWNAALKWKRLRAIFFFRCSLSFTISIRAENRISLYATEGTKRKKARATIRSSFYCNISHTITEMISRRARYRFHLWHVCLSICLVKMIGWSDGLRGVSMLFSFGYLARCRSTHHIST